MKKRLEYITNCVNANGDDIQEMCDQARAITYATFIRHVDYRELEEIIGWKGYGVHPSRDYAVSFYKSMYQGNPCYFMEHSRIEYIWGSVP